MHEKPWLSSLHVMSKFNETAGWSILNMILHFSSKFIFAESQCYAFIIINATAQRLLHFCIGENYINFHKFVIVEQTNRVNRNMSQFSFYGPLELDAVSYSNIFLLVIFRVLFFSNGWGENYNFWVA